MWCEYRFIFSLKKSRFNFRVVKFFGKVFLSEGILLDLDKVVVLKVVGFS